MGPKGSRGFESLPLRQIERISGNANLPIGGLRAAIQENGVPGFQPLASIAKDAAGLDVEGDVADGQSCLIAEAGDEALETPDVGKICS